MGCIVGSVVGLFVGLFVGPFVGPFVGLVDGAAVGSSHGHPKHAELLPALQQIDLDGSSSGEVTNSSRHARHVEAAAQHCSGGEGSLPASHDAARAQVNSPPAETTPFVFEQPSNFESAGSTFASSQQSFPVHALQSTRVRAWTAGIFTVIPRHALWLSPSQTTSSVEALCCWVPPKTFRHFGPRTIMFLHVFSVTIFLLPHEIEHGPSPLPILLLGQKISESEPQSSGEVHVNPRPAESWAFTLSL